MSPHEKRFTFLWLHVVKGTTDLICEHKFHPSRKWRFDFAHLTTKTAIEIEGGTGRFKRGRHMRPEGFAADAEKYNAATYLGWKVFRLTPRMVNSRELERLADYIRKAPVIDECE
jgi:very-short-patch-repair endonuclease